MTRFTELFAALTGRGASRSGGAGDGLAGGGITDGAPEGAVVAEFLRHRAGAVDADTSGREIPVGRFTGRPVPGQAPDWWIARETRLAFKALDGIERRLTSAASLNRAECKALAAEVNALRWRLTDLLDGRA